MESTYIIFGGIILLTGLLGGLTNFLITFDKSLKNNERWIKFLASISLSLCATLTVPLFLQILSNNILDQLTFKNALIFTGFCVLASFFSKRFLDDVYSKLNNLDKKVDEGKEETDKNIETVTKKAENTIKKVEDIEESLEQLDDNLPTEIKTAILEMNTNSLSSSDIENVVKELISARFSFQTIEGIAKVTSIDSNIILNIMETLRDFGFVETKVGSNGKDFWRILKYPIRIYSANYGIPNKFADVTNKIKGLLTLEGTYQGIATHGYLGIDDPAVGDVKVLKIHCRIHGKERELEFTEGKHFKIE